MLVERQALALDAPGQEAALRELLKGASLYDDHRSSTTLAPFNPDLVSCPEKLERCKLVSELLPPNDRIFLEGDLERMLRKDSEIADERVKPSFDPVLSRNRERLTKFFKNMIDTGVFKGMRKSDKLGSVGLFFVKRKDGRLRTIVDARPTNQIFKRPPSTVL